MAKLKISMLLILVISTTPRIAKASENISIDSINESLYQKQWNHGSQECELNSDPTLDILKASASSFIIRQNKCLTYEAPFIYVLIGLEKILVLDTGVLNDKSGFSLYEEIKQIVGEPLFLERELLVMHSHSHSDHYQGDSQFLGKPNTTLIQPKSNAIETFWDKLNWPNDEKTIDLGGRQLTIIPTPGHQEEALSIYDNQTKWLLTGDSLYPGVIYVKNWQDYRSSIAKLASFTQQHPVSAILGTHIEMTKQPKKYYPIGSTYQPDEHTLILTVDALNRLNSALQNQKRPKSLKFNSFIIKPLNLLQKSIGKIGKIFSE